jgi:hypothetical protein
MLVDPIDFVLATIVVFALGIIAGAFWSPLSGKPARDNRGRFVKR